MSVEFEHRLVAMSRGPALHVARVRNADAPRIVLLHGWPQTWFCWTKVAAELDDFDLVIPDLRGLGDSEIANADSGFEKSSLAGDIVELLGALENNPNGLVVVGHDWGGVVAFFTADLLGGDVDGLVVLDVTIPIDVPGLPDFSQGGRRWHHAFHRTTDLPEILIAARPAEYYGWFWSNLGSSSDAIDKESRTEYLRSYAQPARALAGLALYRTMQIDERDARQVADRKLEVPVLALGGSESWGRGSEPLDNLRYFAEDVRGVIIEKSGHWLPEEQPLAVAAEIRRFIGGLGI